MYTWQQRPWCHILANVWDCGIVYKVLVDVHDSVIVIRTPLRLATELVNCQK